MSFRAIEGAQLFIGALGVMTVTGEYTSGLIRGTFLATPQRAQVLAMKALMFAAVGVGLVRGAVVRRRSSSGKACCRARRSMSGSVIRAC